MKRKFAKVSIIVVNYNGKKYLPDCLNSLEGLNYPKSEKEIILVDNGSKDGSLEFVSNNFPKVKVVRCPVNQYCAANNLGIKNAKGEFVALLNNDVKIEKDWLVELLKIFSEDNAIGAVGSKILFTDGTIQSLGHQEQPLFYWHDIGFKEKDLGQYDALTEAFSICGCSVLYRKKCLAKVGLLDEDLGMFLEDVDMGIRCRQKGWQIRVAPKSTLYHKFHGSIGNEENAQFWQERNRLLLIAKHWPDKLADSLSGRGFFSVNNVYSQEDARDINEILGLAFVKIIKEHGLERAQKLAPEIFQAVQKIYNYEKQYLVDKVKELKSIFNLKVEEYESIKKEHSREIIKKEQELLSKDYQLSSLIQETLSLRVLHEKELALKHQEVLRKDQDLVERDKLVTAKDQELAERDKLVAAKDQDLAERDKLVEAKEQGLLERESEIIERDKVIVAKDQQINILLSQHEKELADKCAELFAKDQEISNQYIDLAERDKLVAAKDQDLAERDKLVAAKEQGLLERESEIIERDKVIVAKDQQINILLSQHEKELADKCAELFAKDKEIFDQFIDLAERDKLVAAKDQEISNQYIELAERDKLVAAKDQEISKQELLNRQISALRDELEIESNSLRNRVNDKAQELKRIYDSTGYRYFLKPMWNFLWPLKKVVLYLPKSIAAKMIVYSASVGRFVNNTMQREEGPSRIGKNLIFYFKHFYRKPNLWAKLYYQHVKTGTIPPPPESLILMLSKKCNLSCQFCNIPNVNEEMSTSDAIKVITNAAKLGVSIVVLTGGEPLLHKGLFEIIKYAKKLNLKTCVTTNGLLIKDNIPKLRDCGLDILSVSLDGLAETHDALRRREGLYREVVEGICELKNRGDKPTITINFVVNKKNLNDLESVFFWAKSKGIFFDFWPVNNCEDLNINCQEEFKQFSKFVEKINKDKYLSASRLYYYLQTPIYLKHRQKIRVRCLALARSLGVMVNGDVTPCCVWGRKKLPLGNAICDDLETLWHSKDYHQTRVQIYQNGCAEDCYNISLQEFTYFTGEDFIITKPISS